MTARSKTWSGRLIAPTDEQLEQLRDLFREEKAVSHLAIRHNRRLEPALQDEVAPTNITDIDVLIVFKQPRRARANATSPPFAGWSPAVFETEWPHTKQLWRAS